MKILISRGFEFFQNFHRSKQFAKESFGVLRVDSDPWVSGRSVEQLLKRERSVYVSAETGNFCVGVGVLLVPVEFETEPLVFLY